ncbi:MAG: rhomboid family intramembrane serine protease [Myxococcaceae bacterium]
MLIAANVGVYIGELAITSPSLAFSMVFAAPWAGSDGVSVWLDHKWWLPLVAMFTHGIVILHIAANMWALWNVGNFTERLFGRAFTAFAYLLTGLAGAYMSMLAHPTVMTVGASGAVFGLFGMICGFALRARQLIQPEAYERLRSGILLSLGLNVALSVAVPGIDVAAHLGGLLAGTAVGLLATGSAIEEPSRRPVFSSQLIVIAAVAALAILARTRTQHSTEGKSWERNRLARQAVAAEKWEDAIAAATHALSQKDDRESRLLRGQAYEKLSKWQEALADFSAAQQLTSLEDPELPDILVVKAGAELHLGKTDEAKSDLSRSTDLAGGEAEWLEQTGMKSIVRGDYELAVLALRSAHKRLPESPQSANSLAWALVMIQGDMDEALAAANIAVEKAKNPVGQGDIMTASLGTRCWVHALREDKERAMADCEAAIKSGSAHVDQGMLAYLKGDYKEAVQQWEHAGEDSPFEAREMKPWIERAKSKL